MKVISVLNHKGGVGKSTICLNLAYCYSLGELKVCVIDSDVQGSISHLIRMTNASIDIRPYSFLEGIQSSGYDIVLIDTPPYHTSLSSEIIHLSDFVLVPLKPSYFDVIAMKPTMDLINEIQKKKVGAKGAIVLNMAKHRTSLNDEMKDVLTDYSLPLLDTVIHERVSYVRSSLSNQGVFDSDDIKAKDEITSLASEILQRMNPLT